MLFQKMRSFDILCLLVCWALTVHGAAAQKRPTVHLSAIPERAQCVDVMNQCDCSCIVQAGHQQQAPSAVQKASGDEVRPSPSSNSGAYSAQPSEFASHHSQVPPAPRSSAAPPAYVHSHQATDAALDLHGSSNLYSMNQGSSLMAYDAYKVMIGIASMAISLVVYLLAAKVAKLAKRLGCKKSRRVPASFAPSEKNESSMTTMIDKCTASIIFQCAFLAAAAAVGFQWPEWDWMVLLVVICQHVMFRIVGCTLLTCWFAGKALALSLGQVVGLAYQGVIYAWVLKVVRCVKTWISHGHITVLVTAGSLDSASSCSEDCPILQSVGSGSSSTSSSGSSGNLRQQRKVPGRKAKQLSINNSSSSSSVTVQQQQSCNNTSTSGSCTADDQRSPFASAVHQHNLTVARIDSAASAAKKQAKAVLKSKSAAAPAGNASIAQQSPSGAEQDADVAVSASSDIGTNTRDQLHNEAKHKRSSASIQSSGIGSRKLVQTNKQLAAHRPAPVETNMIAINKSGSVPIKAARAPAARTAASPKVRVTTAVTPDPPTVIPDTPAAAAAPGTPPAGGQKKMQLARQSSSSSSDASSPKSPSTPTKILPSVVLGYRADTPTALSFNAAAEAAAAATTAQSPASTAIAPTAAVPVKKTALPPPGYVVAAAAVTEACAASSSSSANPLHIAQILPDHAVVPGGVRGMPRQHQLWQQQQNEQSCTAAAPAAYSLFSSGESPLQAALAAAAAEATTAALQPAKASTAVTAPRSTSSQQILMIGSARSNNNSFIQQRGSSNSSTGSKCMPGCVLSSAYNPLRWEQIADSPPLTAAAAGYASGPLVTAGLSWQPGTQWPQQQQQQHYSLPLPSHLSDQQLSFSTALLPGDLFADD